MTEPVLVLKGAALARADGTILDPTCWTLEGTGITCLVGLNGSGKTSLLRLMAGLEAPTSGTVARPAGPRPAYLSQRPVMLRRSVRANLSYPLRVAGVPRAEAAARAEGQAEAFGLAPLLNRHAPTLSGGEMQRLALARALIAGPRLILADEPTAALDGRAKREVEARLAEAARGARVVMATHDLAQVRRLAREVAYLHGGRLHERGPASAFLRAPRTPEAAAFLLGDMLE